MSDKNKIPGTDEAWENRELGACMEHAVRDDSGEEAAVEASLELQPISIRLQKSLIEDFKHLAELHGMAYQTLMREVLNRWADCEKKHILREMVDVERQRQEAEVENQDNDNGGDENGGGQPRKVA